MKTIVKAYKFRLYPNTEQINKINQTIGSARFIIMAKKTPTSSILRSKMVGG